jgi:leucyl-tRNA synthetase
MKPYDHKKIEKKWQKAWDEQQVYKTLSAKKAIAKKSSHIMYSTCFRIHQGQDYM